MNVYECANYKDFLAGIVGQEPKGIVSRLAEAAGCQRSYMSDVLRGKVHLTPDHAHGIAAYLKLPPRERDLFLDLVHHARAASKAYKAMLAARIERERESRLRLTERVGGERRETPHRYYTSWHHAALHVATSVPELATVKALSTRFGVAEDAVRAILATLVEDGLVIEAKGRYSYGYARGAPHLPDDSPLSRMNHANWRTLGLSRPWRAEGEVHYSSVFAVEKKDYRRLQAELVGFVQAQREAIAGSGCEEVACFTCDLFAF